MSSGTIGTGSIPRSMQLGIKKIFGDSMAMHDKKYSEMFMGDTSTGAYETYVQMEGFGLASAKAEGDDIVFDSRQQGFAPKFVNVSYAKGFTVTREAIDDNKYNLFGKGASALAESMAITKETIGNAVYNNGFDSNFVMPGGDGSPLFSLTHSNGPSGGTYSNRLTVDADFSEASLENMLIQIRKITNARGLPAALQAVRLIVAPDEEFNAIRVLDSAGQSGTANNDINAVKKNGSIRDGVLVSPYLTDPDAWFILTNAKEGLTYYSRTPVEFDQDKSFTSSNTRFKAYERYCFGWGDARGCFGSQGA